MRTYETQEYTSQRTVCTKMTCDICGREGTSKWESGYYECNETTLEVKVHQKEGATYPDDGHGIEYIIDICPQCFKERLVPWVNSQGGKVQQQEWDY